MKYFLRVRVRKNAAKRAEVRQRQAVHQIILLARGNLNQTDLLLIGVQAVGFRVYRQRRGLAKFPEHLFQQRRGIHIDRQSNIGVSHAGIITPANAPRLPTLRLAVLEFSGYLERQGLPIQYSSMKGRGKFCDNHLSRCACGVLAKV